uniref:Uncharacterized protein n=1 Tax=Zea mays TaxID=4577 RepID=A0A804PR09_MAIZE
MGVGTVCSSDGRIYAGTGGGTGEQEFEETRGAGCKSSLRERRVLDLDGSQIERNKKKERSCEDLNPRWVGARPSAKGGSEVAGDGRERGGNPAAFVFVPRPEYAGRHHCLSGGASQMGRRSCSPWPESARGRVMMAPVDVAGLRPRLGDVEAPLKPRSSLSSVAEVESEPLSRARRRPSAEARAESEP